MYTVNEINTSSQHNHTPTPAHPHTHIHIMYIDPRYDICGQK